ncbi:hypothetical protein BC939DRAFT_439410 [Gamsiella multidivaricata]|uniref:uncharacterized protein n=1 Tax=Gamsiella multidivaricata TaxID=101098 RepID=UPI00221FD13F|nr:uncharacterized protein BC939DRAFT_439410 [Gamsiella multidivaricata]KAG0357759.1 hypothetical protein BGZ54_000210 [Gamsiella multidivaricata]KAI7830461.1 hypothetical protein BC939DRAFT_439410 [Gamsiella multidivaricata]
MNVGNNSTGTPTSVNNVTNISIKAFTSSLLFNGAIGIGVFVAFCIVRHWSKKIYQPRTYLVTKDIRSPELPPGIFSWITASFKVKDTELLEKVGLDAYMFLRFLRMSAMFFGGCCVLSMPILIPLNMGDGIIKPGEGGLASMNIGNVKDSWRLWFHLTLTYIFTLAAILLLWREMREYTRRRHAYLMSEKHTKTPQSTTILITAIPKGLNTEEALYNIFNRFPGGVSKIWLNRHPENLTKLCKERDKVVKHLEMAEYNYIRSAYGKKSKKDPEIKEPQRPIGKTSTIPCLGDKVDLVEFYAERLCQLNQQIQQAQQSGSVESLNSAFIQFRSQFAAHSAVQTVVHPTPFRMTPMYAEISPLDVVWDNMDLNTLVRKGRSMVILVSSTVMILLWTIPTIVISSLATMSDIVNVFSFLSFLEDLPSGVLGVVQGVLPPLLLAGLMALLPFLLTIMAKYEGHVQYSSISLSVMAKYFFFLVINVLLISTLSGGVLKTLNELNKEGFNFKSLISRFSEKLPNASTFFITYVLLRGFTGPALELLQIVPLLLNFMFTQLLAKSPRQIWGVQGSLESVNYGTLFPPQTLMFCIGILYSTIAPLILPFVAFYFTMFYFVYRHQFLYVYHQPIETGGLAFPKAVKQVYTGIFISLITLFGIFLMKQGSSAVPQLVLLVILIVATALSLSNMNEAFNPLVTYLPVALFSKDLHVDRHGVVTEGDEAHESVKQPDEEQVEPEDGGIMHMKNLSQKNLTSKQIPMPEDNQSRFVLNKQLYHDGDDYHDNHNDDHDHDHDHVLPSQDDTFSNSRQSFRHRHPYHLENSLSFDDSKFLVPRPSPRYGELRKPDRTTPRYNSSPILARPRSFMDRAPSFNNGSRPVSFVDRPATFRAERVIHEEPEQLSEHSPAGVELEYLQDQAYCHPSTYDVQKPVWLPIDERGLAQAEIDWLRSRGIVVATDGAVLDSARAKAKVAGIIYAPGDETRYRLERGE